MPATQYCLKWRNQDWAYLVNNESKTSEAIGNFNEYADEYGITQPWLSIIQETLSGNLAAFGYIDRDEAPQATLYDRHERTITDLSVFGQFQRSITK